MLTHIPPAIPVPGVTFVGTLDSAVAAAKQAAGDRYVNVLGASVARQCLDAGMLDEIVCSSRRSCSATAFGSSIIRVEPASGWNAAP